MEGKVLNNFSVESNGETITVNVVQTDKGVTVDITGTTMDVLINNEEVYSKFDKPEYKNIPSHLRGFVEEHLCDYGNGIEVKDGKVCMEVDINGRDYGMVIPTNRAKCKEVSFSDWLESYEKIIGYDIEIPNAKENYDKLIKDINDIGYRFELAWGGNEYDDVFKLVIPLSEFDENKLFECVKLWSAYNIYLNKYIKMI